MSKDPAFLFYPNDYIGGTMGMTFEEKGAYMELLMMQFNRGHMTSHMIGQTVGQLWDTLKDKFTQDENGLWYNVRLEEEQKKRKEYTQSRRNNKEGKNQYTKKEGHMTSHMENENVNEDIIVNTDSNIEEEKEIFNFKKSLIQYGFNKELVNDWMIVRKGKRLANTQTAYKTFIREVEKANYDKNALLEIVVAKSWGGFESGWNWKDEVKENSNKINTSELWSQ